MSARAGNGAETRRRGAAFIDEAIEVLTEQHPMTVRQLYYQLVARQAIENTRGRYQAVSKAIVKARKDGRIPWHWIDDRMRRPRHVSMWSDLSEFGDVVCSAYRRDVWKSQPVYLEVWVEKDALSGLFEDVLDPYGVTLNVGRGYDGWSSIQRAAERLRDGSVVLYFGDFDPSGEDMVRSLRERIAFFGVESEIVKCALTADDIARFRLPPAMTKKSDSRRDAFVARHGDVAVELDALPRDVLQRRLTDEVESRMDLRALERVRAREARERQRLKEVIANVA